LRAAGVIGERFDGFVVAREPTADVQAIVDQVNAKRLKIYGQRAAQEGVAVASVGRVYSRRIMEQAPAGCWFLTEAGYWQRW